MEKKFIYKAFGFTIQSEVECPELIKSTGKADVKIQLGTVPSKLDNPLFTGVRFQTTGDKFLLTVDGVANFFVENGKTITIEIVENASIDDVRVFLFGSAFGAIIHQLGRLPIHGSAIKIGDTAIILSGNSGVGKSTLAAAFRKKGYQLLSDDISVISFDSDHTPWVYPGYPLMKLWKDSIKKLGTDPSMFKQIRKNIEKHYIPISEDFWQHPSRLERIFVISTSNKTEPRIEECKGIEKFNLLKRNTYRFNFIVGNQMQLEHFKAIDSLIKNVKVYHLERPTGRFILDEMVDLILAE